MILSVSNLSVARGGVTVLDGVSLEMAAGEALLLRGPNGSGKTTLLRTLAGLQPPVAGTVAHAPEAIAYAGHADGIKSTLTVEENLRFWASVFGTGTIENALAAFELEALRARAAQNLSAGQKRRLGLARLLVTGRPIWLLDEPTVSLDDSSTRLFAEVLRAHLDSGGAALIATHIDPGFEARIIDVGEFRASATDDPDDPFDEAFA